VDKHAAWQSKNTVKREEYVNTYNILWGRYQPSSNATHPWYLYGEASNKWYLGRINAKLKEQ
jgi:hypothetical protein